MLKEWLHSTSSSGSVAFLCIHGTSQKFDCMWVQDDICGQSCRIERVNVDQLQQQDINLALLRRKGVPPPHHLPQPTTLSSFWDFHRSVVLSTCRRLWKHTAVYSWAERIHNNPVSCINKAPNPGFNLILKVTMVNHLSFGWLTTIAYADN